ncbi:MAG: GNAT family N-acetyltransferase [Bacteroidales bacterium]|nr:GNAT family N-acetyltransferase [Bacteroidales bacterium]
MNCVYHRNKPPYGYTTTIITEDASAYVMITQFDETKETAVIHDLVVLKDRRGEGLGSKLLEEAIAEAGRMGADTARLSVETGSWLAEWYKRHGFHETGDVEDLGKKFIVLERSI